MILWAWLVVVWAAMAMIPFMTQQLCEPTHVKCIVIMTSARLLLDIISCVLMMYAMYYAIKSA